MGPMPPISASAGGGGPSSSGSNAGVQTPFNTPFNFDHSGWNVNMGSSGPMTATGNTGANQNAQAPNGAGGGLLSGKDPIMLIGMAVVVYLLARR